MYTVEKLAERRACARDPRLRDAIEVQTQILKNIITYCQKYLSKIPNRCYGWLWTFLKTKMGNFLRFCIIFGVNDSVEIFQQIFLLLQSIAILVCMQDGYIELNMKMQSVLRPKVKKREALGELLKGFLAAAAMFGKTW